MLLRKQLFSYHRSRESVFSGVVLFEQNTKILEIHIGILTHYTSGVRNGRLCQELHLHASAWWADVCQFQFTTLGWLKLVLNNILKTGWCHN